MLDVGCGAGGVGRAIRDRADSLIGIEPDGAAADEARDAYDTVLVGFAEDRIEETDGPFDTILLYDVLEHVVDPGALLRLLRAHAAPGALLHVSVPNARHWSLARDLVFRGTFGYAQWGHRDNTHLRWFTSRDLAAVLEETGWRAERVVHGPLTSAGRLAERVTRGLSAEFLVHQWSALARADGG